MGTRWTQKSWSQVVLEGFLEEEGKMRMEVWDWGTEQCSAMAGRVTVGLHWGFEYRSCGREQDMPGRAGLANFGRQVLGNYGRLREGVAWSDPGFGRKG